MSKDCKSRTCSLPNCWRRHSEFQKDTTKSISDATTAVATNIAQGGLSVVRIKLSNSELNINVLEMCNLRYSISIVDKPVVYKLPLQGSKASLSVAGIYSSQDVNTEIAPIAVSAQERSRPMTTLQFYLLEKLKIGGQIVELQELQDRYSHLSSLPDQT